MGAGITADRTGAGTGGCEGGGIPMLGPGACTGKPMPTTGPLGASAPIGGCTGLAIIPGAAAGIAGTGAGLPIPGARLEPQLRQNRIPGGFSPRQTGHIVDIAGNPTGADGVCAIGGVNELPQFRQNDDPDGLSWPHIVQRI